GAPVEAVSGQGEPGETTKQCGQDATETGVQGTVGNPPPVHAVPVFGQFTDVVEQAGAGPEREGGEQFRTVLGGGHHDPDERNETVQGAQQQNPGGQQRCTSIAARTVTGAGLRGAHLSSWAKARDCTRRRNA